jgi:hypothetical protein
MEEDSKGNGLSPVGQIAPEPVHEEEDTTT